VALTMVDPISGLEIGKAKVGQHVAAADGEQAQIDDIEQEPSPVEKAAINRTTATIRNWSRLITSGRPRVG